MNITNRIDESETQAAIETLKCYLVHQKYRIRLRELVWGKAQQLQTQLSVEQFPVNIRFENDEYISRIQKIESSSWASIALISNGCYWGEPRDDDVWLTQIRRLANIDMPLGGSVSYINLFGYPAALNLYGAAISAIATEKHGLLKDLFLTPSRASDDPGSHVVAGRVCDWLIDGSAAHELLPELSANRTYRNPVSLYLQTTLRPIFSGLIPSDSEYLEAFDRFEYLSCLVSHDLSNGSRFRIGSFAWRNHGSGGTTPTIFAREISDFQSAWPPLREGLFGGSLERLQSAKADVDRIASRHVWR